MSEATNQNPQPPEPTNQDLLFADLPDDDIFKAAEPSKGINRKAVIATLPDDAKRIINDVKLGAQKAALDALESKKGADAARAEAERAKAEADAAKAAWEAKLGAYKPEGDDPLAAFAANPKLARLYGLVEGDVFEAPPEVDVDVPEVSDEALSDPAKLHELLREITKKAASAGAAKAREEFIGLQRESMKPVLDRAVSQREQAAKTAAATKEMEWRKAHGLEEPGAWADFYAWSKEAHKLTEERWPYADEHGFTVGYKAYAADKGIKPPAAAPAAAAPAKLKAPQNQVQQLLAALRRDAQGAQGGGGVGIEDGELVMPMHVRENPVAMSRWIESTPAAKQAFADKDQEAIKRIMRKPNQR